MTGCCNVNKKTSNTNTAEQTDSIIEKLVNNLKSSIFCETKGFLTFNLAFLSYLEYSLRCYVLQKQGKISNQYIEFKKVLILQ
ncbi:MAG: hypothetical protein PV340_03735 [Wolbachia sp.]|nr:hypothetical protein [Wolbachia sp.]MDD9335896.1 hypothetical protein [Wolbachia sp.]